MKHPPLQRERPPAGIIRLHDDVRTDLPSFISRALAQAGEHVAYQTPNGAVYVVADDNSLLGIKPDEYEWVTRYELEAP